MIVSRSAYRVFYEKIRAAFFERELKSKLPSKARGLDSPTIWDEDDKDKKGEKIATRLFAGAQTTNHRYFYRKFSDLKTKRETLIDDVSFKKGLEYIGVTTDGHPKNGKFKNSREKCDALYSSFCELYKKEILEIESDDIISNTKDGTSEKLDVMYSTGKHVIENEHFQRIKGLVTSFYEDIAIGRYEDAWEKLTYTFRKRVWQDDFNKFAQGYIHTRGIRGIEVSAFDQASRVTIDCAVAYEDEIEVFTSPELESIKSMTVQNLDEFTKVVKNVGEKIKEMGGVGFDKIELYQFFNPSVSEYIWYTCNIPPEQLGELFNTRRTAYIKRRYICTCHLVDADWYIERIRQEQVYSSR